MKNELAAYCNENTALELRDVFKYLYQSSFGCEHLAVGYGAALDMLEKEAVFADEDDLEEIEYLPGGFCRVHLKALKNREMLEKLCRLFLQSAEKVPDGAARLEEGLTCLAGLAEEKAIPFTEREVENAVDEWRKDGFPAVRHSETFRNAHRPAYRVIRTALLGELTEAGPNGL